jgi:hypothetical protein
MEEEKKISKFSSGINILQRVDFLWKNCHNFKRSGLYHKWNEELDSVWLELARDLKEVEYYDLDKDGNPVIDEKNKEIVKKGYKSQFESFEEKLKELMPFMDSGTRGFQKPEENMIKKRNKQYKLLMEKQLFLARLENELGKGTSWEEEDDDF